MNRIGCLLALLVIAGLYGCDTMFLGPDPENTPVTNFEIFWSDFDRYYAQFEVRHIDWDSVYAVTRPRITAGMSDRQLYDILAGLVGDINDMHVGLNTPLGSAMWSGSSRGSYPSMRLINAGKYIQVGAAQHAVMEYRRCLTAGIGYLIIPSFDGTGTGTSSLDTRYEVIDDVLAGWKDMRAIIIDVRWNGGGNSSNAEAVAGRFADATHVYAQSRQKNGPGKSDFSPWTIHTIGPKGAYQFTRPVVVLTSRATSSSAEVFVLAMQSMPHVIVIGDTTGGGVGNPVYRELPNGWTYRLSTKIEADAHGRIVEGTGVFPSIPVRTTVADSANGTDRILEKALNILGSGNSDI
jgi:carboxyl-terminal processing protease